MVALRMVARAPIKKSTGVSSLKTTDVLEWKEA